jgi:hypothetical protein
MKFMAAKLFALRVLDVVVEAGADKSPIVVVQKPTSELHQEGLRHVQNFHPIVFSAESLDSRLMPKTCLLVCSKTSDPNAGGVHILERVVQIHNVRIDSSHLLFKVLRQDARIDASQACPYGNDQTLSDVLVLEEFLLAGIHI